MKTWNKNILAIAMAAVVLASFCAIFSASAQTPTVGIAGAPAAVSRSSTTIDLFIRGTDNALWQKTWNGTAWSSGVSLGGVLASDPAATVTVPGNMSVYVRGTNGAPYEKDWNGSAWGNWIKLGGLILPGTGPAAYPGGIFVTGMNSALYWGVVNDTGVAWTKLDGVCTSSPGAVQRSDGTIEVFVRGTSGALWQLESQVIPIVGDGSIIGFGPWTNWGGVIYPSTSPAVTSPAATGTDVFVKGMNGALYLRASTGGTPTDWQKLDGYLTSSPGATSKAPTTMDVFVKGGNNGLWQRSYNGTAWGAWTSIGGM